MCQKQTNNINNNNLHFTAWGWFAYTHIPKGSANTSTSIESKLFGPPSSPRCLKFAYHMYGADTGKLTVYLKTNSLAPLWNRTGSTQQSSWQLGIVNVQSNQDYKVSTLDNSRLFLARQTPTLTSNQIIELEQEKQDKGPLAPEQARSFRRHVIFSAYILLSDICTLTGFHPSLLGSTPLSRLQNHSTVNLTIPPCDQANFVVAYFDHVQLN